MYGLVERLSTIDELRVIAPESNRVKKSLWKKLRECVHSEQIIALEERQKTNPYPTQEELSMGIYIEEIEPQCRKAIIEMQQKGYLTVSSGFALARYDIQQVDGNFTVGSEIVTQLHHHGYAVDTEELDPWTPYYNERNPYYTTIRFYTHDIDLTAYEQESVLQIMEERWNTLAGLLPDLGAPAPPASVFKAFLFRQQFQ